MTLEIARSLTPDDSTLKRAEALANPRKWVLVECNDRALWGECSGSGSEPYRAIVDMNGPAYKCSCPVKRLPCKHTLALLILAGENAPNSFGKNPPPPYVTDWLESRDQRQAAKAIPKTEEQIAKSEASKEKNWSERLDMMRDGVDDLQNRLLDMLRNGIAALDQAPPQYYLDFAARMVDAKLGGLSKRVKSWAKYKEQYPEDWYERLLEELGSLYLMTKAFKNFDTLNEGLQNEIMAQMGVNIKKEELLSQEGIIDDWLVLAQVEKPEEDNLTSRKVWLRGKESGKTVMILDFSFGGSGFPSAWINGYVYRTEVVYYPSAYPLRVVNKAIEAGKSFSQIIGYQDFIQFQNDYTQALSLNPWLSMFPALLANVIPVFDNDQFFLIDAHTKMLPIAKNTELVPSIREGVGWKLMALSGGNPLSIFGEWDGKFFMPLSAFSEERMVVL